MFEKLRKWWLFHLSNPVVREGEQGGFKWRFRRFTFEAETLSGNFKAEWTADIHPYAYLISGKTDENIHGFLMLLYMLSKTLTADQSLVDDVNKALKRYEKRTEKNVEEDPSEETALEEVRAVQEHVELPKKERKKEERRIDKRFKKAVKEAEKNEN